MRGPRLLLVLLLLTAFTLSALDARAGEGSPFEALRRGADVVLGPPQRALGGAARAAGGVFAGDSDEQAELRAENQRLRAELRRSEGLRRRVQELDALLALPSSGGSSTVPARATAFGSAFGFTSTVTIDAGSADGIEPGQTVLAGEGLLGRTLRVGPFSSTVLLLTDPGFTVGARSADTGTFGLATGDGEGLVFSLLAGGRVSEGEGLLTAGSDTFVPDVPIGRVTAVAPDPGTPVTTATVRPFVDVSAVDLVGVVTSPPRSTPRVPLQPPPPS